MYSKQEFTFLNIINFFLLKNNWQADRICLNLIILIEVLL